MNNPTLEAEAFAARFESSTAEEVIKICQGDLSSFNICSKAENWKAYIKARYGRKYIDGRPDIVTVEQLMEHARLLENGVSHNITTYLAFDNPIGLVYMAKICNSQYTPVEDCDPEAYITSPGEIFPGYELAYPADYYGTIEGLPITSENTIFYACQIETNFDQERSRTTSLFASPALCAEYSVQFLNNYQRYYVPEIIAYRLGFDDFFDHRVIRDDAETLKNFLLDVGTKHKLFMSALGFEDNYHDIDIEDDDGEDRAPWTMFYIRWFPVAARLGGASRLGGAYGP